jgi:hypothetical protein
MLLARQKITKQGAETIAKHLREWGGTLFGEDLCPRLEASSSFPVDASHEGRPIAEVLQLFGRAKEFVTTSPNWLTPIDTGVAELDDTDDNSRLQHRDLWFFPFLDLVQRVYALLSLSSLSPILMTC